jgi:glycosyltransferase involved in cell wall biosynthesis
MIASVQPMPESSKPQAQWHKPQAQWHKPQATNLDRPDSSLLTKLTIAIPFFRGSQYLRQAIESVLRQSQPAWQLLVCDDASPEIDVRRLVLGYRDPRIRYVRNERNLGMVGNWNRCLDLAPTDLVTLLHADDQLLDCYVAMMTEAAEQHPKAVALFCRARIIDQDGRSRFSFPDLYKRLLADCVGNGLRLEGPTALEALLRGDFIMCPTVCYRKSRLGLRRFSSDWRFAQDMEFFTRLLFQRETLIGLPAVGYAYRRHRLNATAEYTKSLLRFEEESRLYDALAHAAHNRGWEQAARLARRKSVIKLNLLYCSAADLLRLRLQEAWQKLVFLRNLTVGRIANPSWRA